MPEEQNPQQEQQQQPSNNSINYTVARVGMDMDNTLNQVAKGKLLYANNATVSNFSGQATNYQNEQGNELCFNFPKGYQVCGRHFILEKDIWVFFLVNPNTGDSEIGTGQKCIYTTIINAPCLGFSLYYPIKRVVHKITNCSTEIYWTDNNQQRRWLNFDNLPYKTIDDGTCTQQITTDIDCNKLLMLPAFIIPNITIEKISSEGEMQAGTYQFGIQYSNSLGQGYTSYYGITNPVPVFDPNKITLDFNYLVSKSITVGVNNIDVTGIYDYFNLAVIKTVNNIRTVELVGTYPITNPTKTIIYTGQNQIAEKIDIDEIIQQHPYYPLAKGVTSSGDILIWYGLTQEERISYQNIANQIHLQWETIKIPADSYKDELICNKYTSYLRDEVYAFEIRFYLENGYLTDGFHIPSRISTSDDLSILDSSSNLDVLETQNACNTNNITKPKWQVYNTAFKVGDDSELHTCNFAKHEYGEFAYWESTETYPCNIDIWGDLAGQPIRHHKFPDCEISPIHDNIRNIYPIGLRIDTNFINLLISSLGYTRIKGYEIVRGNRANNKSIIAKGLLNNCLQYIPTGGLSDNKILGKVNSVQSILNQAIKLAQSVLKNTPSTITVSSGLGNTTFPNIIYYHVSALINSLQTWEIKAVNVFSNIDSTQPYPFDFSGFNSEILKQIAYYTTYQTVSSSSQVTDVGKSYADAEVSILESVQQTIQSIQDNPSTSVIYSTLPSSNELFPNYFFNDINNEHFINGVKIDDFSSDLAIDRNYTFYSPDTLFNQPSLGNILKLESIEYGLSQTQLQEVKKHAKYQFLNSISYIISLAIGVGVGFASGMYGLSDRPFDGVAMFTAYEALITILQKTIPYRNFCAQFVGVGDYFETQSIRNKGFKQRAINDGLYLNSSGKINLGIGNLNNYKRGTSVFLNTVNPLPLISKDNKINGKPLSYYSGFLDSSKNVFQTENIQENTIASYYGAIKEDFVNQYGQIYSYETVSTGYRKFLNQEQYGFDLIFGGDTFINKFAFKNKFPLFTDDRVNTPDGTDISYNDIPNVGNPKYTFSTNVSQNSGIFGTIFGVKDHNWWWNQDEDLYYNGKILNYFYGIPYFFCESQINCDKRQSFNSQEGDFYPRVGSGIPFDWVQEYNVPIIQDNTYYYNKTLSKQNIELYISHLPIDYTKAICRKVFPFKTIYSEKRQDLPNYSYINNWLIYKPVSKFDFPQNFGLLTSLNGMENKEIMAVFENKCLKYDTVITNPTSAGLNAAYIGNDTLFSSHPPFDIKNADTDQGYVGSQHDLFIKTEHGNIVVDAKRGQVFLIDSIMYRGIIAEDITGKQSGVQKFFTENLRFKILDKIPNVDIDNNYLKIGLHGVYDSKLNRLILTKLDYLPLKPNIKFDGNFYLEHDSLITQTIPGNLNCCPDGYLLQYGVCVKQSQVLATPAKGNGFIAKQYQDTTNYSAYGAYVYQSGYNINGTSNSLPWTTLTTPGLWRTTSPSILGRLNVCGLWDSTSWNTGGNLSFVIPIVTTTAKQYYLGIGADNVGSIKIGCTTILSMDPDAMSTDHFGTNTDDAVTFQGWHIYPINLPIGTSYITVTNYNVSGTEGIIGFEIYDATLIELEAMVVPSDLDPYLVFSTASLFGQSLNNVDDTSIEYKSYTCPNCIAPINVDGTYYCVTTETIPTQYCPPTTIQVPQITKEYIPITCENFKDCSFTISYDFDTKSWISFHSYQPNFYIGENNFFLSGINDIVQSSLWQHLKNPTIYNTFYGNIESYILEYPFSYQYNDELLQNVKDYTKVLQYIDADTTIEQDNIYFNTAILYNGQQCSGILNLVPKPLNSMKQVMQYPMYAIDSKTILFTKRDNFYQFNTFWSLVKDNKQPIFQSSCTLFKELNQSNMDYGKRSYRKEPLRAKELKVRLEYNLSDKFLLVSQFTTLPTIKSFI